MADRWLLTLICISLFVGSVVCSLGWLHIEWRGWGYVDMLREDKVERVDIDLVDVVVDTLRYCNIEPIEVVLDTLTPRLVVAESAPATLLCDSLYTFRDTLGGRWSAEVSGLNVQLRSLELHDRVEYSRVTSFVKPRWDVALKIGVAPNFQWGGVGVTRNIGRLALTLDCGYDRCYKTPFVGASAAFSLWRE